MKRVIFATGLLLAHAAANAWFFFIPTGAIQSALYGDHCVSASTKAGDKLKIDSSGREWLVKETNGTSYRCKNPSWPVIAKLEPILTQAELRAEHTICVPRGATVGTRTTAPVLGEVQVVSLTGSDCGDERNPVSARVVRIGTVEPVAGSREVPAPSPQPTRGEPPATPSTSASTPPPSVSAEETGCVPLGAAPGDKLTVAGRQVEVLRILRNHISPCSATADAPLLAALRSVEPMRIPTSVPVAEPARPKSVADRLRELKQLRDENLITESVYETKQKEILSAQ